MTYTIQHGQKDTLVVPLTELKYWELIIVERFRIINKATQYENVSIGKRL